MKRPAVFFDRDNTLIISDGYLGDPAQVQLVPGAADAVAKARALGFATVIVSNQSGVARGMFDEAAVQAVNARLDQLLREQNPAAIIDRHEYCPYHPQAVIEAYRQDSDLRKPKPGMLLQAATKLALDLPGSWMIGDAPRDVEAAHAAGCRTILFQAPQLVRSDAADVASDVAPDYVVSTLAEAMSFIERHVLDEHGPDATEDKAVAATPSPMRITPAGGSMGASPAAPTPRGNSTMRPTVAPPKTVPGATPSRPAVGTAPPPSGPRPATPVRPAANAGPPAARTTPPEPTPPANDTSRLESLTEQILVELRRRHEQPHTDFSASKLLASMLQVVVLAVLFMSYVHKATSQPSDVQSYLLLALTLQTMTIALLIMSRPK